MSIREVPIPVAIMFVRTMHPNCCRRPTKQAQVSSVA